MNCKKCGYEWQAYGEHLTCPSCGSLAVLTASEQQSLWEEAYAAEKIKDYALRANCFLRLAEQGDRKAAFLYAESLSEGWGIEKDQEEALLWYKAAAAKMHPTAAYRLAECLKDKRFGNNEGQVFFWMCVAAEFGDADAMFALSSMYEQGFGTPVSHRHALYYLTESAKAGSRDAALELAKMYISGDGVEQDCGAARYLLESIGHLSFSQKRMLHKVARFTPHEPNKIDLPSIARERFALGRRAASAAEYAIAANIYFIAAREGDAEAAYALALCFEKGMGVPQSESEAYRRFELAAEGGYVEAYLRLAEYVSEGKAGEKDAAKALSFYKKAAEKGSAEGAFRVGEAYRYGTLADTDLSLALSFYSRASALGHETAKEREHEIRDAISVMYEQGCTLVREGNYAEAHRRFKLAADMGHAAAACFFGALCAEGVGTAKDMRLAVRYYRKAAELGNLDAVYRLGIAYMDGTGVGRDFKAAESLLTVAAKQNYKDASSMVEKIKRTRHKKAGRKAYAISSVLYRRGDVGEAIHFRTIAAKLGVARAMYVLGCHFEFGDGVPMDREKAAAWYQHAAASGYHVPAGSDLKGGFLRERKQLLLRKKNNF